MFLFCGRLNSMSTKSAILAALQSSSDFISGESLAESCGVSRTSVWKAIKALQSEGCQIDAVSNRGYRLTAASDEIDGSYIAKKMTALGVQAGTVTTFREIDSTLSESKRQCAAVSSFRTTTGELTAEGAKLHRALIVAGKQTAGRGRMGRAFVSPPNSGVYFTLVYAPKNGVTNPALLTAAAAVAVARATDELFGTHAQIKWVNDVFLDGKKICGILTEGVANFETGRIEAANVGIGINVRDMGFSAELADIATSIQQAAPDKEKVARISRNDLVAQVVAHLLAFYDAWEQDDVSGSADFAGSPDSADSSASVAAMIAEYKSRSLVVGKTVTVNPTAGLQGVPYSAKVLDIADDVSLVVQLEDGSKKMLQSGEVSLHSAEFTQ